MRRKVEKSKVESQKPQMIRRGGDTWTWRSPRPRVPASPRPVLSTFDFRLSTFGSFLLLLAIASGCTRSLPPEVAEFKPPAARKPVAEAPPPAPKAEPRP